MIERIDELGGCLTRAENIRRLLEASVVSSSEEERAA
jgi:hypothetical protein